MLILTMKNYKTGLTVNNLWYLTGDWLNISSEKNYQNIYNLLMNYAWSWKRKVELSTHYWIYIHVVHVTEYIFM